MQGKRYISWMLGIMILAWTGWSFWIKRQEAVEVAKEKDSPPPAELVKPLDNPVRCRTLR